MTFGEYCRAGYTQSYKDCCGEGCCFKISWCYTYTVLFWTLDQGLGIPEAWGIIFCCCQLCPVDAPPEGSDEKIGTITQLCKCYTPCSKEHCDDTINVTCNWCKDEVTCGIYGFACDMRQGGACNGAKMDIGGKNTSSAVETAAAPKTAEMNRS